MARIIADQVVVRVPRMPDPPRTAILRASNGKVHSGLANAMPGDHRPACDRSTYAGLVFAVVFVVPERTHNWGLVALLREHRVRRRALCGHCFAKWWRDDYAKELD